MNNAVNIEVIQNSLAIHVVNEEGLSVTVEQAPDINVSVIPVGERGPKGDQGEPGPQGPPGPPGNGETAATFVHYQATASATWVINHNLGYYPNVTVVDSSGREVFGDKVYNSINQVTMSYNLPFGGTAYLS